MQPAEHRRVRNRNDAGFTLLEIMVVMTLGALLLGMAVMSMDWGLSAFRADSALDKLQSQIYVARELALSHQRSIELRLTATGVEFVQLEPDGTEQSLQATRFEGRTEFILFDGMDGANAPPDPWCQAGDTRNLNAQDILRFNSRGSLVTEEDEMVSGCFFIGTPGQPSTARALSVFGASGRVRRFAWNGASWAD